MLYLEDLIVLPDYRGRGAGMQLLRALVEVAANQGCRRVQWAVLDWYLTIHMIGIQHYCNGSEHTVNHSNFLRHIS
jgi:GNAT superfamily N-acetyltransferase